DHQGGGHKGAVSVSRTPGWGEVPYETSPPQILASDHGRCRAAVRLRGRAGTSLSVAAGAHHRRICPAGGTDIMARLIGQWLSERLRPQVVIQNQPGGARNVAPPP